jgi:hypothetical protein
MGAKREKLKEDLREAIRLIRMFVDGEYCTFHYDRKDGETCKEAQSRKQGVPMPGCDQCQARDFLKKMKDFR